MLIEDSSNPMIDDQNTNIETNGNENDDSNTHDDH